MSRPVHRAEDETALFSLNHCVCSACGQQSYITHLVKEDLSLNEHPGPAEVTSHPNIAVKKKYVWQKCG